MLMKKNLLFDENLREIRGYGIPYIYIIIQIEVEHILLNGNCYATPLQLNIVWHIEINLMYA